MRARARSGRGSPRPAPRMKRVLVVDDHPVLRGVVRLACNASPTLEAVAEAEDGTTALELCRSVRPDLLVLDLVLPGVGGIGGAPSGQGGGRPVRALAG